MNNKILVTGGAGYLGSILIPKLLDYGYFVTVYDNFMRKVPSLYESVYDQNLSITRGDIRDFDKLKPLLEKNDIIVHLAAIVGAPACDQDPYSSEEINLGSTTRIVRTLSKDQQLYFACTNSGYGTGDGMLAATEETPLKPISLYGRTKVAAESEILDAGGTSLRLATLFGFSPRMRLDLLINDWVYKLLKEHYIMIYQPNYKRNAVHVRDAADAFLHAINNDLRGPYNVGLPDANKTKLELAKIIQLHIDDSIVTTQDYHADLDQRNFSLDSSKLIRTGYTFSHGLQMGISELIKGYTMLENRRFCNVI